MKAVFWAETGNGRKDWPDSIRMTPNTHFLGLVNPHLFGQRRRLGQSTNEALRIFLKGTLKH